MEVTPEGAVHEPDEVNTTSCVTGPGGLGGVGVGGVGGVGVGGVGVGGVGVGVGMSAKVPAPLALRPPRVKIIGISGPYAKRVRDAKTVKVALPVFTTVYVYASVLEVLPTVGVPPCQRVVTPDTVPSTCTWLLK